MFESNLVQRSSIRLSTCLNVTNSLNLKIQHGGGRHLEFRNMSILSDWLKIFVSNLVERCILAMRRRPRDQQELSYRKQITRQLRTQYVEGINNNPVTLKSRLRVTQDH